MVMVDLIMQHCDALQIIKAPPAYSPRILFNKTLLVTENFFSRNTGTAFNIQPPGPASAEIQNEVNTARRPDPGNTGPASSERQNEVSTGPRQEPDNTDPGGTGPSR